VLDICLFNFCIILSLSDSCRVVKPRNMRLVGHEGGIEIGNALKTCSENPRGEIACEQRGVNGGVICKYICKEGSVSVSS
jgi:hypothetical protein